MATIARNIGAAGRRQRLLFGTISLVIGIAAAALLMTGAGGVSRGARLLLFLPFLGAALGLMQARDMAVPSTPLAGTPFFDLDKPKS